MSLKNSIIRVFSANFIKMISSILISFLLPMVLSIQSYSDFKTYTFYISYISFFSLGFLDGMYIKYGGKELNDIDLGVFKLEHTIYIFIQVIFSFIFFVCAFISKNIIIFFMALTIVPANTIGFFQINYQAMGEFKKYSKITHLYNFIYLILNILLVLVFRNGNYIYYCLANIVTNLILFILLEINIYKLFRKVKLRYNSEIWNNIKIGLFILIGNLSVMFFYGIDRWFIKIFYNANDFAYYSFALSMLSVVNVLVSAVSITFYNYIAKYEDKENIKKIKKYLIILGAFSSAGYFAFSAIINIFLEKYIPSLDIISVSFSAYPYMIVINAIFINLYKARKDEKRYLKVVLMMVGVSIIYNLLAIMLSNNPVSIAVATTASFITWYIYSAKDFDYLKCNKNEIMFLIINLFSFIICAHYLNWIIGGTIYLTIIIITCLVFFRDESNNFINYSNNIIKVIK